MPESKIDIREQLAMLQSKWPELLKHYDKLAAGFDRAAAEALLKTAASMEKAAEQLKKACGQIAKRNQLPNPAEFPQKLDEIRNLVTFPPPGMPSREIISLNLNQPGPQGEPSSPAAKDTDEEIDFGGFIGQVSDALVSAQEDLNYRSLEYARDVLPGIPPAHYAIPSVKAEMKVGLRSERSKKLNVILFGKKESHAKYGESTVSFEVVSAPPPPGGELIQAPPYLAVGSEFERLLVGAGLRLKDAGFSSSVPLESRSTVALRYHRDSIGAGSRYLLLSGVPDSVAVEKRDFLAACVSAGGSADRPSYGLETAIFTRPDKPANGFVHIPDAAGRNSAAPGDLYQVAHHSGDLLMNVVLLLQHWLGESVVPFPGFLLRGEEREAVLDGAASLKGFRGVYSGSKPLALALRRRTAGGWGEGRLVLWPGRRRAANAPEANRKEFAALPVRRAPEDASGIEPDPSVFTAAPPDLGFLEIPEDKTLKDWRDNSPDRLAILAGHSSDVLGEIVDVLRNWIGAIRPTAAMM